MFLKVETFTSLEKDFLKRKETFSNYSSEIFPSRPSISFSKNYAHNKHCQHLCSDSNLRIINKKRPMFQISHSPPIPPIKMFEWWPTKSWPIFYSTSICTYLKQIRFPKNWLIFAFRILYEIIDCKNSFTYIETVMFLAISIKLLRNNALEWMQLACSKWYHTLIYECSFT